MQRKMTNEARVWPNIPPSSSNCWYVKVEGRTLSELHHKHVEGVRWEVWRYEANVFIWRCKLLNYTLHTINDVSIDKVELNINYISTLYQTEICFMSSWNIKHFQLLKLKGSEAAILVLLKFWVGWNWVSRMISTNQLGTNSNDHILSFF